MVHFAGYAPRFHPSDFRTLTNDGVGADWPIEYGDLKRYYELLEAELPVAGQNWPWGDPHRYPHSPHPMGANGQAFQRAALAAGIDVRVGPVAITNGRFGNRSHCIYRGFCLQGCKVNAKASPLITHVPDALAHGAEIRPDCMVSRVEIDEHRRATGIVYFHEGTRVSAARPAGGGGGVLHRDAAPAAQLRLSAVSARACATSSTRSAATSWCRVRPRPPVATTRRSGPTKPHRPNALPKPSTRLIPTKSYKRGFSLQCISPLPIVFAEHVCAQGHWGETLREYMRDSVHWATFGALCEFLPLPENRITLADETDRHGLPVANFSYSLCDNDEALVEAATKVMEEMHHAAGAAEAITIKRDAHLIGGCRMAAAERDGVVDANLRSFAVPNLFIVDGSVCPDAGECQSRTDHHGPRRPCRGLPHVGGIRGVETERRHRSTAQGRSVVRLTMANSCLLCLGPRVEMPQQIVVRLGAAGRPQHRGGIILGGNLTNDDLWLVARRPLSPRRSRPPRASRLAPESLPFHPSIYLRVRS